MIRSKAYENENGPLVSLVTTPIGNMEDITYRAVRYLKEADIIACEDTRNTSLLLSHFNIKAKKLISLYAQTELKDAKRLVLECKEKNLKVAYCSDAGMPGISDPGALLCKCCQEEGIPCTIIPGPNAALSALVISGIDSADFSFFGFLPTKAGAIKTMLEGLKSREESLIFYESPKRVNKTLEVMHKVFGDDREIALIRELTKIHEEVIHGSAKELAAIDEVKGECVIIVKGAKKDDSIDETKIKILIKDGLKEGKSLSSLSKELATDLNISKNVIYKIGLEIK